MVFKTKTGKKVWTFGGTMVAQNRKIRTRKQAKNWLKRYRKKK